MSESLPLVEPLLWRGSGSLRVPSAFRHKHNINVKDLPDPIGAETSESDSEIRLTYIFPKPLSPPGAKQHD